MLENNKEKFEEEKTRLKNNQEINDATTDEKAPEGFIHLHVLTEYSLGRSVAKIKELVREAKRLGMTHLAITDAGNIHAVPLFCNECHQQGLVPIIGCELQVVCHTAITERQITTVPSTATPAPNPTVSAPQVPAAAPSPRTCPMVVLCCSVQGYFNLLQLLTLSHTRPQPEPDQSGEEKFFAGNPGYVTPAELQTHSCGLVLLSGGADSELNQLLLEGAYTQAQALVQEWQRTFYKSFYLEIQEHGRPEEKVINQLLQKLGREQDLELIATNDVRYVHKEDAELLTQMQALKEHRTILEPAPAAAVNHHLCSAKELAELQAAYPQALANTRTLVHSLIDSDVISFFIEQDNNLDEAVNLLRAETKKTNPDQKLQDLCAAGLKKLYPHGELPMKERLMQELQTIFKLQQSAKFIQAYQTLQNIRQLGHQAFLEPGPVYGSLVAYLLGLTPLDPVRFQLQGEKFLYQKDGQKLSRSLRCCYLDNTLKISQLQACLVPLYGKGRVVPCFFWRRLPFNFFVQRLARYYQLPRETAAKLQALCFGKRPAPNLGTTAKREKFLSSIPKLRQFLQQEPLCARIFNSAYRLTGLSDRRLFRNNANLILLPPDQEPEKYLPLDRVQITTWVPCAATSGQLTSADTTSKHESTWKRETDATLVSHYDEAAASAWGFTIFHRRHSLHLKILDKLTRSLAAKKITLDFTRLPLDDAQVFRFLNRDSLIGIFPPMDESGIVRRYLRDLAPENFNDLIIFAALTSSGTMLHSCRPAIYLQLRRGGYLMPESSLSDYQEYPCVLLGEPLLEETDGLILYEEQVQQLVAASSKFSERESVELVRALTDGNHQVLDQFRRSKFTASADQDKRENDHISIMYSNTYSDADDICYEILKNRPPIISKTRAAAAALEIYQRAYVKYYYPTEFLAAYTAALRE